MLGCMPGSGEEWKTVHAWVWKAGRQFMPGSGRVEDSSSLGLEGWKSHACLDLEGWKTVHVMYAYVQAWVWLEVTCQPGS